jgi:hypothetical protein
MTRIAVIGFGIADLTNALARRASCRHENCCVNDGRLSDGGERRCM